MTGEPCEEGLHDRALVGLETRLHQRGETAGRRPCSDRQRHRAKLQHRGIGDLSGVQETPGLQQAQLLPVAAGGKKVTVQLVRLQHRLGIASAVCRMAGHKIEPIAGERGAHPAARQGEGRARPITIALLQQRQVEQPFAGIIENFDGQLGGAAEQLGPPKETRRGEPEQKPHPSQIGRARGPVRWVGGERCDRFLERERRHIVGVGREQPRANKPPLRCSP